MNTYNQLGSIDTTGLRHAPLKPSNGRIMGPIGKHWRNHLYGYPGTHSENVRTGRWATVLTAATIGLVAALSSCANPNQSPERSNIVPPCVTTGINTIDYAVQTGDTETKILTMIPGVTLGTCMETAENMTTSPNGGNIRTPRAGDVFVLPGGLTPAADQQKSGSTIP